MKGITGYVSIMTSDKVYLKYNKLRKLKHDLQCLTVLGFFDTSNEDIKLKIYDVKRLIMVEERKMKLKMLKND